MKKKTLCSLLCVLCLLFVTSCDKNSTQTSEQTDTNPVTTVATSTSEDSTEIIVEETETASSTSAETETSSLNENEIKVKIPIGDAKEDSETLKISLYAKNYEKDPYIKINNNHSNTLQGINLAAYPEYEYYTELDSLGRTRQAFAIICKETLPTEERGEIGQIKPSGWHTVKYDKEVISDLYLYNRCHLIAYMLSGENANPKNLITGTRYLNVKGMLPFEEQISDYMETHPDNHVAYRVTPVYDADNLLAEGVLMEAYSLEDNGKGIDFYIFAYNVQPGIEIDYKTGDSKLIQNDTTETATDETETKYVLNTNSKKIHMPDCESVEKISNSNKETTNKTISELEEEGYEPCKICNPQE